MKRTNTPPQARAANESILPSAYEGDAGPDKPLRPAGESRVLEDWELILVGGGDTVTCW